jgi:hypothetical protein
MASLDQIVRSIDARVDELHREVQTLTRARQALVASGGAHARPEPTSAQGQRPRPARRRRSPSPTAAVSPDTLLTLISANDGLSTAALAQLANVEAAAVLPLLREMETSGRVRRTGQRRATRWHAVTSDEDWVAQRAAELAARSRAGRPADRRRARRS